MQLTKLIQLESLKQSGFCCIGLLLYKLPAKLLYLERNYKMKMPVDRTASSIGEMLVAALL